MARRLDSLLVARGFGPRGYARDLVRKHRVSVDEVLITDPGQRVADDATLRVGDQVSAPPPVLVAWHKPVGVVTTLRDPWGREGVDAVLPATWRASLHAVGRLDQDTSGLLLFSGDGALTQQLLHPKHAVPRSYVAGVAVDPPDDLADRLAAGVETSDGVVVGTVTGVSGREVRLTVCEGKHRMVRRMLHNAGASVLTLHRDSYGPVLLGDLAPREVRVVDADAVRAWLAAR